MGRYLEALKKRNITAFISKGNVALNIPEAGISDELSAKIKQNLKAIKAELLSELAADNQPEPSTKDSRDSSPLMAAIRKKRKTAVCPDCGDVVDAQEYPQPSEGWHFIDCPACEFCGTICLDDTTEQADRLQAKLDNQGWALMRSAVLGEPVALVVAPDIQTPEHLAKAMRYTLQEAACLRKAELEMLRKVHEIKQIMGGTVEQMGQVDNKWTSQPNTANKGSFNGK